MEKAGKEVPVLAFGSAGELRAWLAANHQTSDGIWVRIYKQSSGRPSVTFLEVLDEGLCFGWSEGARRKGDRQSFLQRFTPRKARGTTSKRNLEHVERLIQQGRMTSFGLKALGLSADD